MNETISMGGRPVIGFGECPIVRPEGIYYGGKKVISLGVGALQRQNPLPAGKYWVDVFEPDWSSFQSWLTTNKKTVRVNTTESFPENSGGPARNWYLFTITGPTPWNGPGFPTIAGPGVNSSADTADRPPPEKDPLDQLHDQLPKPGDIAKTVIIATAVVVVVVVGGSLIAYYSRRPSAAPAQALPSIA